MNKETKQNKEIKQPQPLTGREILDNLFESEKCSIDKAKQQEYINALKTFGVAQDLTPQQMYYFMKYCHTLNLNPLLKQIHCVVYKGKNGNIMTPIVSYYEYIKKAEKHPLYQLPELEYVDYNPLTKEPFKNIMDHYVIATVQRKGETTKLRKVFYMNEWNKQQGEWREKPRHMLEVRALKNILAVAYPSETADYETLQESWEAQLTQEKYENNETKIKDIKKALG